MEIKTIKKEAPEEFDAAVNAALADGWCLTDRKLIQTPAGYYDYYNAELVKLDPPAEPAEPEQPDPFEALRTIQAFCMVTSLEDCTGERCPLEGWCSRLTQCTDPSDWRLPAREDDA